MLDASSSSEVKIIPKNLRLNDFWNATTGTEASIWLFYENRHLTLNSSQAKTFCGTNLKLWELMNQLSGYTVLRSCVHPG